jgi:hypothetical protein
VWACGGPATDLADGQLGADGQLWGDGGYAIWIGRSVEGEPVCFVVDLLVFSDSFGPIAD